VNIPLLTSKKMAAGAGAVGTIMAIVALDIPTAVKCTAMACVTLVSVGYSIGTGLADAGKERAKIEVGAWLTEGREVDPDEKSGGAA